MGIKKVNEATSLLGVDASDRNARGYGLANSVFENVPWAMSRNRISKFTHFEDQVVPAWLKLTEEGSPVTAAAYGDSWGTLTTDDVGAKTEQLTSGLLWTVSSQAADQPLTLECKWKSGATITTVEYWIGFTDASPDTDPIALSSTSTFTTSVPTNGVYMGFSTTPTSGAAYTSGGNLHTAISINADTNAIVGTGGGVFVAATNYTYRIEVDANGTARYYLNDTLLWTKLLAVATTAVLCAMICVAPRTTSERVISVDYLGVSGAL